MLLVGQILDTRRDKENLLKSPSDLTSRASRYRLGVRTFAGFLGGAVWEERKRSVSKRSIVISRNDTGILRKMSG